MFRKDSNGVGSVSAEPRPKGLFRVVETSSPLGHSWNWCSFKSDNTEIESTISTIII